jgi:hypothetical protein
LRTRCSLSIASPALLGVAARVGVVDEADRGAC